MADFLGSLFVRIDADTKGVDKKIDNTEDKLTSIGKTASQVGSEFTAKLTLPILAAGAAAIKLADDAVKVERKFNTAFRGIEDQAAKTTDTLRERLELSTVATQRLLSNTGDLFKGFNATSQQALDLSEQVQVVAGALAEYNNVQGGVSAASEIVTKATLGERDALVSLGVKISEADLKQELLRRGQEKLTGQAALLARAEATLSLIYAQSSDALDAFSNKTEEASNLTKQIQADVEDLAVEIGKELLPVAKDLLTFVRDLVRDFKELDDQQKQNVIGIAGFAAAIGPIVSLVGAATQAVGALSGALTFLAANPIVAVIGALGALALAVANIQQELLNASAAEAAELLGEAAENAKLTRAEINIIENQVAELDNLNLLFDNENITTVRQGVAELAKELGTTEQAIIEIGLNSEIVNKEIKEQLATIKEQNKERQTYLDSQAEQTANNKQHITQEEILQLLQQTQTEDTQEELAAEKEILDIEKERIKQVVADRTKAQEAFNESVRETNTLLNLGLIDAIEANERLQSANETLIEQLIKIGYDGLRGQRGDIAIQNAIASIEALKEKNKELLATTQEVSQTGFDVFKEAEENKNAIFKQLFDERKAAELAAIVERQQAEEEALNSFKNTFSERLSLVNSFADSIKSIFSELTNQEKTELENREFQERRRIENTIEDEEKKKEALENLDKELAAEKRKIKRKEAEGNRNAALFDIAINTVSASIEALPNLALSAIIGGIGLTQAALVASRPLPALKNGGVVNRSTVAEIGEAGTEIVAPITGPQGQKAFEQLASGMMKVMGNNAPNRVNNVTQNFNSTFNLADDNRKREAARALYPYIVEEQKRTGVI